MCIKLNLSLQAEYYRMFVPSVDGLFSFFCVWKLSVKGDVAICCCRSPTKVKKHTKPFKFTKKDKPAKIKDKVIISSYHVCVL